MYPMSRFCLNKVSFHLTETISLTLYSSGNTDSEGAGVNVLG